MRTIWSRPIKSLEAVTIGIAEFENTLLDCVDAGGIQPGQDEMKSDLNAILPPNLSEQLATRIADSQYCYQAFRDFVLNRTALILMNRNRLPIHAAVDNRDPRPLSSFNSDSVLGEPYEEESGEPGTPLAGLQAVLNKARGNGGGFQRKPGASRPLPNGAKHSPIALNVEKSASAKQIFWRCLTSNNVMFFLTILNLALWIKIF